MIEIGARTTVVIEIPDTDIVDFASVFNELRKYHRSSGFFRRLTLTDTQWGVVHSVADILMPQSGGGVVNHVSTQHECFDE